MKRKQYILALFGAMAVSLAFSLPLCADEAQQPYLILWDMANNTGQVMGMTAAEPLYTLTTPILQGKYTYRIAIGANKTPIYGQDGKLDGKPIPIELTENRRVTFSYDPQTHLIATKIGETFVPPKQVVLVGNLQKKLGHTGGQFGGEWDPAADTTRMQAIGNDFYVFSGKLPAGAYEYKVAIGGSWKENYGQDGKQDGANIQLTLAKDQEVTFCYNDRTHKIADSTWYALLPDDQLPRLVGDLQTAVGTDLILRDDDFDQVYSLSLPLKKGSYTFRVALGAGQQPVYGTNGEKDGAPLTLNLKEDRDALFFFDLRTHAIAFDDGSIADHALYHDTYSSMYREPFEPVKTGQAFTLRFHARKGDITAAKLIIGKGNIDGGRVRYGAADREYPMTYLETRTLPDVGEIDLWEATLTLAEPGLYGYKFKLNDLKEYGDDMRGGGVGKAALRGAEYFQLTVYDAAYTTPNWLKTAIVYQIFPDRFFNGNPANDRLKMYARGFEPVVLQAWNAVPSAPSLQNDPDTFWNNDFFGGDLEGIRQKLDYLQSLGVTVIYLNPIVTAASNHKYDATDYDQVDPMFGTAADFTRLTAEMAKRGMHLILDGVFNHVGDDSIYFDRYGKYDWVGAYEYWSRVYDIMNAKQLRAADAKRLAEAELLAEGQELSPYEWQNWFTIRNAQVDGRYDYQGWAGYDSLPVFNAPAPAEVANPVVAHNSELNMRTWADYILFDENSVAKRWLKQGASGWRLDVATEVDAAFWQAFRKEVKAITLPSGESPVILGETWQDASHFFLGDQFDSVMNYGFRYAALDAFLLNGNAANADLVLNTMRQNYPKEAFYALLNLIGSHDTTRAIYVLGGGKDESVIAAAGKNFDAELGKARLKLAAIFQMGYPGAPTIYYGDEVGLTGARDPDCRRPYPWGQEDADLLAHYRKVTQIRRENIELFAYGDVFTLYADGDVYVYGRANAGKIAVIAINRGSDAKDVTINLKGSPINNVTLTDQLDPAYTVNASGSTLTLALPPLTGRMLIQ